MINLDFRVATPFEAFDKHQICRPHMRRQLEQVRFRFIRKLVHQSPALGRDDHHFRRAGAAVFIRVFAGMINIEFMMRPFDRGDPEPTCRQHWKYPRDQGCFAAAAPACKSEYFHQTTPFAK